MTGESITAQTSDHDDLYRQIGASYSGALERLARTYELDTEKRRDLLQEIHLQLWRSVARFDGRCSLRTWVYRFAHHTATSHMDRTKALVWLSELIQKLWPLDKQVIVLYLEELDAASIGEITGILPRNVAMKIHSNQ